MDEHRRKERELEAWELVAAELEKLRILRGHERGVRVVYDEGALFVRPA